MTGERPVKVWVEGLPAGLTFDPTRQELAGTLGENGSHVVTLHAKNSHGQAKKTFKIVVGDVLALTPPLGWNSWNCFAEKVDAAKIRLAADAMVSSGLIEHGWAYINIDDTWQTNRDPDRQYPVQRKISRHEGAGRLCARQGIKDRPLLVTGPKTCDGYEGSWQHENQDARRYAAWGFDYFKYDWCTYDEWLTRRSLFWINTRNRIK